MKPVQNYTGFIFCTFSASVLAKYNYQEYFRLQGLKSGMKENASDVNKGNEVYRTGNVQSMKPVQFCIGFIFCTFSAKCKVYFRLQGLKENISNVNKGFIFCILSAKYEVYFRLQGLKENTSDVNKGNDVCTRAGNVENMKPVQNF